MAEVSTQSPHAELVKVIQEISGVKAGSRCQRTAGQGEVLEGEHSHSFRRCPKEQQRKGQYVKKEVGSKGVSLLCLFV